MPSRRVPPERRKRTEISCDKCKSRKQKCHRQLSDPLSSSSLDGYDSRAPCRYCQTHGLACVTTQTRKKRVFATVEESLKARVGLLESLVKGLVPADAAAAADTSSVEGLRALGASLGIPMPVSEQSDKFQASSSPTPAGASLTDQVEFVESSGGTKDAAPTQQPTHEEKEAEKMPVLRDQQGQMQYIGPASSYIFQIRMRALLAGRDPHCRSQQGQFFLFANHAADRAWVGRVADLGREMSGAGQQMTPTGGAGGTGGSPGSEDGSEMDADSSNSERETSMQTEESFLSGTIPDRLVDAYFERIHPDFPVLSEECFRRKYERFRHQQKPSQLASDSSSNNADIDASWICSFLCILILARRTVPLGDDDDVFSTTRGKEAEDRWWRKVQTLLPSVIFTSCITAVQALLLAALHLNNTNNKDSCWTLTGAAVRIAVAIGLHRDAKFQWRQHGVAHSETAATTTPPNPVLRLRIRLWWTLYQFEHMQAASLDRPSAICDASCNNTGGGGATIQPPPATAGAAAEYYYSTRLLGMLSQACRVVRITNSSGGSSSSSVHGESAEDTYNGPLSPAASLIRDMRRWRDTLPHELSQQAATAVESDNHKQEAGELMTPRARRMILLMHVQYHHILCVITRNPMLTLTSRLFDSSSRNSTTLTTTNNNNIKNDRQQHLSSNLGIPEGGSSCNAFLTDVCIDAAQESVRLLFRLDADGLFDQVTWWDFYFLYQAAQVLVLGVMYDAKRGGQGRSHAAGGDDSDSRLSTSRALLRSCAELAGRVARNPLVPGTIHRFAVVVGELVGLVEDFIRSPAIAESSVTATSMPDATTNAASSSASSCFRVHEDGGHDQQQPSYSPHKDLNRSNRGNPASQMDIDPSTIFQEDAGLHRQDVGDGMAMAETPLDIQFPADMAAHFGFPDGSWTYREGQWSDFSSMILGGGYGP
ncbi:hypothetical protein PG993_006936 [Apiospora rasikravindrae]|uniref:Zn(2)-C6 fungal-type domain-containing protein n=1 Tax=Apiospora rasikravindrae TaxID=990691 RepID=A0ABR1SXV3_9PEZI